MKLQMPKLTFWKAVFVLTMLAGLYATFVRFTQGLGGSTHLSDAFPWGIWIGFDVLCGVMLAAGGFTLVLVVEIFNIKRFKPIIRPTVLTAFLGYGLVCLALLFDLGKPYNIWHPLIMWNPHSVMFEVGWCVMLYTTVLALEFAPVVLERFRQKKMVNLLHKISVPIFLAGVILSTLHQSSLGSVYLIMKGKLHPLWYSPLLPVFFFISAVAVGLAMMIFESNMSAKHFHKQLEQPLLAELGRILLVVLVVYGVLRFEDLWHRGALAYLTGFGYEERLFAIEIFLSLLLPIVLLVIPRVRNHPQGLYVAAVSVVLGFVTNRLNVSITGMEGAAGVRYIPSWMEIAVTAMIVAAGFAVFAMANRYLPIFITESEPEPEKVPAAVAMKAAAGD